MAMQHFQLAMRDNVQDFSAGGMAAAKLRSHTFFECTLSCKGESVKMPVQTCTLISELKEVIAAQAGYVDPSTISFVVKQGCTFRRLLDEDTVLRNMTVWGINSLKPGRHKWPHPYGIIGAGYTGIKTALVLQKYGSEDFVVFDRYDQVGGHTWLEMANRTTKLQTEFPTYHVWYGPEFSAPGIEKCGGAPIDHEIWPSAQKIADHFQYVASEYGLLTQCHLGTNVEDMEIVGKITDKNRHYNLTVCPVKFARRDKQGGGALAHQLGGDDKVHRYNGSRDPSREPYQMNVSCLAMWPGALVFPRPVIYKGEDLFGGPMDYAVEMRFDYSHVPGKVVTIIGHGAFTMENIRTCLEERAKHIYVLCRKVNLTCPRPCSWFINQSNPAVSAAQILDILTHAYKYIRIDGDVLDPWTIHSVMGNSQRTHATIMQKTRFGIGDVYFLSSAYGLMDIIIGEVKRCTHHTLHLDSGSKLQCEAVLKCTGCLGDWKVDQLLKIKEMRGMLVNGDFRRICSGEADGINAAQFSITTGGPGIYGMVKQVVHFWDVPNDWYRLLDLGIIDSLPTHKAGEPTEEFPAYFFTASHAQSAGIVIGSASPLLQQKMQHDDAYKHYIQTLCCPLERILRESKADWEQYEEKFRERGMVPANAPYVPYLYGEEFMLEQFNIHKKYVEKRYGIA